MEEAEIERRRCSGPPLVETIKRDQREDGGLGIEIGIGETTMRKIAWLFSIGLVVLLSIFMSLECVAGVVIEQLVREREGIASTVFLYFSENQFRTDHPERGLTTILDFKGNSMMMVDHQSKRYTQTTFSQWEKEVAERLKKESPAIPPKARKIVVKGTGETATINGFQTEKIQIFADEKLIEEDWVTREVDTKEVENVMEKVARRFSKSFGVEMKEGREIYEKLKPYGFPILVQDYTISYGTGPIETLEVKKLEQKPLEDEVFLPPAGYQRIVPSPPKK